MDVQRKHIVLLLVIIYLQSQVVFSQHISKNNYTGNWETPASWSPTWPVPQTNISGYNITINGYITVNGSLSFLGTCVITINDTLVIKGDLSLGDNCDLTINNNGILIIRGNLSMHNHSEITGNGYLIITGNIDKHGPNGEGSLTSNDDPVKVFVGGTISPANLTNNEPKYPALDCTSPPTTPYPHSGCSYWDMTDIITDPIYPFFQSTCATATLTSSDADNSFCTGTSVTFTASGGTNYNFRVNGTSVQNGGSTTYTTTTLTNGKIVDVIVTSTGGCLITSSGITNTVFALPVATTSNNGPICVGNALSLTGGPAGMTTYSWTGPNGFTSILQNPSVSVNAIFAIAGVYTLTITNTSGCTSTANTTVTVNEKPVAVAGPDQDLKFIFETQMNAELSASETGEWSLISGSGHISDIHSPTTRVTELSTGVNKFLWKVLNGNCEDTAEVKITIYDLFVPSVITPDGDGKNDYFKIGEKIGQVELIIFDRWGNKEYTNGNYLNDWDGRNNKGAELPNDTYFYVLKFENSKIKKGSVLIKR